MCICYRHSQFKIIGVYEYQSFNLDWKVVKKEWFALVFMFQLQAQ